MKQIQVKYTYDANWNDKYLPDGSKAIMKNKEAEKYVNEFNNGIGKLTNTTMRAIEA